MNRYLNYSTSKTKKTQADLKDTLDKDKYLTVDPIVLTETKQNDPEIKRELEEAQAVLHDFEEEHGPLLKTHEQLKARVLAAKQKQANASIDATLELIQRWVDEHRVNFEKNYYQSTLRQYQREVDAKLLATINGALDSSLGKK